MKTRVALMLAVGGLAAAANAQTPQVNAPANVAFTFTWQDTGNNNNIVEPGEGARISMTATMLPAANSPITWNTSIGGDGDGTIRAIQSMFFNLVGGASATGTWSNTIVDELYDLVGPGGYGTSANGGASLNSIQAGQFPASQAAVMLTNPIVNVWSGTWTPSSYAARTETFTSQNGTGNPNPFGATVIVRDGTLTTVFVGTVATTYGSASIPIVPAPSSLALLGLGGLVAARRRR